MFLGQIEPGGSPFWDWKDYTFARFQAQAAPLLLHSVAVAGLSPGLLSIRLASVATVGAALVLAALVIRRRLGARVAWWMLALAAVSPFGLGYARTGFYVAASILHSVVAFAALLRFVERGDRASAALLGIVLGGSLYFYQLSWFVPVLAGLAWLACAIGRPGGLRAALPRPLLFAGVAAALVLAPAPLLLREGLADVASQTFDHRSSLRAGHAELLRPLAVVRAREEIGLPGFADVQARLAPLRAKARVLVHEGGVTTLRVSAPRDRLEGALAALPGGPWRVLTDTVAPFTAPHYVARMIARLLYSPGSELGAWIPNPLLNPLVAPLVLLGFATAWRRRAEPVVRALSVWVVGGALIPAAVGGDAARRGALILPLVHALAAFPLVEVGAWCRASGPWSRRVGAFAAALYLALVVCVGSHQYFRTVQVRWQDTSGPLLRAAATPSILELVKAIKAVPDGVPIQLLTIEPGLFGHLEAIEAWPKSRVRDRITPRIGVGDPRRLVAHSCEEPPPFVWIAENSEEQRALLAALDARFETRSEVRGPYRLVRVDARREGACPEPP